MQSAPASFRRRTDQSSRRSGSRPGPRLVVAGLLVRQQQPGVLRPALARGKPHSGSSRIALACGVSTSATIALNSSMLAVADAAAAFLGERLLQRSPLIHRRGGNHAPRVRNGLHAGQFSRCTWHLLDVRDSCRPRHRHFAAGACAAGRLPSRYCISAGRNRDISLRMSWEREALPRRPPPSPRWTISSMPSALLRRHRHPHRRARVAG